MYLVSSNVLLFCELSISSWEPTETGHLQCLLAWSSTALLRIAALIALKQDPRSLTWGGAGLIGSCSSGDREAEELLRHSHPFHHTHHLVLYHILPWYLFLKSTVLVYFMAPSEEVEFLVNLQLFSESFPVLVYGFVFLTGPAQQTVSLDFNSFHPFLCQVIFYLYK